MEWNNIYITGNPGFKWEVSRKLDSSDLDFMPGYLGGSSGDADHDMYWVDKEVDIKSFKLAIGAKAIWKYRIRFYTSLEELSTNQSTNQSTTLLTQAEKDLIDEMRKAS